MNLAASLPRLQHGSNSSVHSHLADVVPFMKALGTGKEEQCDLKWGAFDDRRVAPGT